MFETTLFCLAAGFFVLFIVTLSRLRGCRVEQDMLQMRYDKDKLDMNEAASRLAGVMNENMQLQTALKRWVGKYDTRVETMHKRMLKVTSIINGECDDDL